MCLQAKDADGCGHPQELDEAGGTVPRSLRTERGPGSPWWHSPGPQNRGRKHSYGLKSPPQFRGPGYNSTPATDHVSLWLSSPTWRQKPLSPEKKDQTRSSSALLRGEAHLGRTRGVLPQNRRYRGAMWLSYPCVLFCNIIVIEITVSFIIVALMQVT